MADARLTDAEIDKIVNLLTTWQGKLSWELLLRRVRPLLGRDFTRQGLDKQQSISIAFKQAKDRMRIRAKKASGPHETEMPPELAAAQRRIDNLLAEVELLKAEKNQFLERFATWLYNARSRGLSEIELSRPLPPVDRGKSERDPKPNRRRKR